VTVLTVSLQQDTTKMEHDHVEDPNYAEGYNCPHDGDSGEYVVGEDIEEWVDENYINPANKLAVNAYVHNDGVPRLPFVSSTVLAPAPFPQHLVKTSYGPVGGSIAAPQLATHHPVMFPPVQNEPLPANYHLGQVLSRKHVSLRTLRAQTRFRRGTVGTTNVINRPWLFNYRFPGREEFGVYYIACPARGCPALFRHPLIHRRGEGHLGGHGAVFNDEEDMMRKFAVQGTEALALSFLTSCSKQSKRS